MQAVVVALAVLEDEGRGTRLAGAMASLQKLIKRGGVMHIAAELSIRIERVPQFVKQRRQRVGEVFVFSFPEAVACHHNARAVAVGSPVHARQLFALRSGQQSRQHGIAVRVERLGNAVPIVQHGRSATMIARVVGHRPCFRRSRDAGVRFELGSRCVGHGFRALIHSDRSLGTQADFETPLLAIEFLDRVRLLDSFPSQETECSVRTGSLIFNGRAAMSLSPSTQPLARTQEGMHHVHRTRQQGHCRPLVH